MKSNWGSIVKNPTSGGDLFGGAKGDIIFAYIRGKSLYKNDF